MRVNAPNIKKHGNFEDEGRERVVSQRRSPCHDRYEIVYPGAFYHVTSRGNEQKDVFKSKRDREKFLEYLESATERYGAVIHVW